MAGKPIASQQSGPGSVVAEKEQRLLQFAPWQSSVEPSFWERLASHKLNTAQLSEAARDLTGNYAPAGHAQSSSPFYLSADSFGKTSLHEPSTLPSAGSAKRHSAPGALHNFNTVENFKATDKAALLKSAAEQIWRDVHSGKAEADPSFLNRFLIISFADLKKWSFYYRVGYPALVLPKQATTAPACYAPNVFGTGEVAAIQEACESWKRGPSTPTSSLGDELAPSTSAPFVPGAPAFLVHLRADCSAKAHPLLAWDDLKAQGGQVILAFYDPCHLAANPGWPLRNLLVFAVARWSVQKLRVLSIRERRGRPDLHHCPVFDVTLSDLPEVKVGRPCPDAVGWELNAKGKSGPRFVDLAPSMDPTRLAVSAADLNLKLMRWRLLPSLDLPKLTSCCCLILGAGTLGCQVARGLMAWGIRHITFVDCGRVAMSNPLRQSLYALEDCLEGGKPKAQAAADSLKRIYPGVVARGIQLAIPMPGHPVGKREEAEVREACESLEALVREHECVFLGTDTRESRWLPTLLCAVHRKVAINAALGFDTFLVMRHGVLPPAAESLSTSHTADQSQQTQSGAATCPPSVSTSAAGSGDTEPLSQAGIRGEARSPPGEEGEAASVQKEGGAPPAGPSLGCYFCNDVVAPLDSTANRSLDQQCTVTRPGLAPMAAALAVELAVSLLHHPLGAAAPADPATAITTSTEQPLGIVPHQVRGFLAYFAQLVVTGQAFDKCTACSAKVISEYKKDGVAFLLRVFNEPTYLEDLTGLTEMLQSTPGIDMDWDEDDETAEGDRDFVEL